MEARRANPTLPLTLGLALLLCAAHAWHARHLGDDGAILWRFAKHFADGHGLVYNIEDEPLDGFTNLPWTLVMAGSYRLALAPEDFTFVSGVLLAPLALVLTFVLGRRAGAGREACLIAVGALALNHSWATWASGGLGTRFSTILLLLAWLALLRGEARAGARCLLSSFLFGLAIIARPESAGLFGLAFLWLTWRRKRWFAGLPFLLVGMGLKLAHLLFSFVYFDSWLPNTAHAKVTQLQLDRGGEYLLTFGFVYSAWVVLALALPVFWPSRQRDLSPIRFLLVSALAQAAAVAAIGGGLFEFRLLDAVLPGLYLGASVGLVRLVEGWPRGRSVWLAAGALVILASSAGGSWLRTREIGLFRKGGDLSRIEGIQALYSGMEHTGRLYKRHLLPDERIALRNAGIAALRSELYVLDMHGLNDRVIARREPGRHTTILWHTKMAKPEDYERARIDFIDPLVLGGHPAIYVAKLLGLPPPENPPPDEMPDRWRELARGLGPFHLCVRLEGDAYLFTRTRLPAASYHDRFRSRGYAVLF